MSPLMDLMIDVVLDMNATRREPVVYNVRDIQHVLYDGDDNKLNDVINAAIFNSRILFEYAYLIDDYGLVYVSSGIMGVDGIRVFNYFKGCPRCIGLFHTHPIPLPIPTPSDALNAYSRGSLIECVGSMIGNEPVIVCIKPRTSWKTIASRIDVFTKTIEYYTDAYAPVDTVNGIFMAPYPSPDASWRLLEAFRKHIQEYAKVEINVFK